jgi:Flp pilus assembly protein TadD
MPTKSHSIACKKSVNRTLAEFRQTFAWSLRTGLGLIVVASLLLGHSVRAQISAPADHAAVTALPAPHYDQLVRAACQAAEAAQVKDALLASLAAIAMDTNRFEAFTVCVLAMMKSSEPNEARFFVTEALKRVPPEKRTQLLELQKLVNEQALALCLAGVCEGNAHFLTNDFAGAATLARKAAQIASNRYEPPLLLALVLHRQGRQVEARQAAQVALQLAPEGRKAAVRALLQQGSLGETPGETPGVPGTGRVTN